MAFTLHTMNETRIKYPYNMKNLFTLLLTFSIFSASAQYSASLQKTKDKNDICLERGHSITYTKSTTTRAPYTIDTKDSTVTVYPVPNATTGKCSRCGAEIESYDKDIRVTTWRRVATTSNINTTPDNTDWGTNSQRSTNKAFKSSSLNDLKKVATLRNDTLFIHKRVAPFNGIKEQVTTPTTLYYKNNIIVFKAAIFDDAAFYSRKNGLEIF
jgi:hypothetical protein